VDLRVWIPAALSVLLACLIGLAAFTAARRLRSRAEMERPLPPLPPETPPPQQEKGGPAQS
jgi:hypothetical protein